jgi:hypothetical protein
MRKALVVGIDHYSHIGSLAGCVNDAHSLDPLLKRHSDGSVNFGVKLMTASGITDVIDRASLKDSVKALFTDDSEIALFYFAGHGWIESTGGYLCASDCRNGDDGLPLAEVLTLAHQSPARNKVIILDSCHSGVAGVPPNTPELAELSEGLTILTASTATQYAAENNGHGVFTDLLIDALAGSAANLVGDVTPGSIYAHVDQSLGPWKQRPVFKTNVKSFVSLRKAQPPIPTDELRRLAEFFPRKGFHLQLDPTFEPERTPDQAHLPPPDPQKNAIFAILQRYNRVNLVVPVDAPHMWHAAMHGKLCKLTVVGEHYRELVENGRI